MRLIDDRTKQEIKIGDIVTTFDGDRGVIKHMEPPLLASNGYVSVELEDTDSKKSLHRCWYRWYPSVIGAHYE